MARSLANNIRFGLHVIARCKATKQSIAGSSSTPSNGRSIAAPVTPWLQMPSAPEMCSSRSHDRSGMFAQRHIFFRLRAFISGCLAALDAAPPFPARVMPMEIGISFSCPKKSAPAQPAPHEPKDRSSCASLSQTCLVNTKHLLLTEITAFGLYCPLSGQAFAAAFFFDINNSHRTFL